MGQLVTDNQLVQSSVSNEHYTPEAYIEAARDVLGGIDLDPASCAAANKVVKATKFYSIKDNGLTKPWKGRVWLNPPYGGQSGSFVAKLMEELRAERTSAAIILVNATATDTAWFQPLWDGVLCFTNHRINFAGEGERSGSTFGSVFVYFGPAPEVFAEHFEQFGALVARFTP
jgi:ParB family chromosome partitioning protein